MSRRFRVPFAWEDQDANPLDADVGHLPPPVSLPAWGRGSSPSPTSTSTPGSGEHHNARKAIDGMARRYKAQLEANGIECTHEEARRWGEQYAHRYDDRHR